MATLPSRKVLESMKRVDLQKICKDYGVKANLKSEALVDLLLDTQKPTSKPAPTRRSVSTRLSSRAGPSRISSVIIHDTDEEDDHGQQAEHENPQHGQSHELDIQVSIEPKQPSVPMTRTRKTKEQKRLGVGRPVAAGGTGPRSVTKSMSVSRGQRGKGSRMMKLLEPTIPEEEIEPAESTHSHTTTTEQQPPVFSNSSLSSLAGIDKHVADALRPLHEQMESLKAELELMQSLKSEMGSLKGIVETLTAEVQDLRTQAASAAVLGGESTELRDGMQLSSVMTPKLKSSLPKNDRQPTADLIVPELRSSDISIDSNFNPSSQSDIVPTTLGKRNRDSVGSNTTDFIEENGEIGSDGKLNEKLIKPVKKRAKISGDDDNFPDEGTSAGQYPHLREDNNEITPRTPSFTVFGGSDELPEQYVDPPPPTDRLPDFFATLSPPADIRPSYSVQGPTTTNTVNESENRQPFAFSSHPISSTPAHGMFMPSFPYPEPPQSPSPMVPNPSGLSNYKGGERTDIFQTFGLPPPGRPPRPSGSRFGNIGIGSRFVDPAALTRQTASDDQEGSSNDAAKRSAPAGSSTRAENAIDAPSTKRTMYGTELEGDTRFGDFGVEGVGSSSGGFWAGGRY